MQQSNFIIFFLCVDNFPQKLKNEIAFFLMNFYMLISYPKYIYSHAHFLLYYHFS